MTIGVAVIGLGAAIAAPGAIHSLFAETGPIPIAGKPADNFQTGMVYAGLTPAKKGQPCVGSYTVAERGTCTHGPDAAPVGLSVHGAVAPIAPATATPTVPADDTAAAPDDQTVVADDGGTLSGNGLAVVPDAVGGAAEFTIGASGVACDGDGVSGKRVQVLYVRDASTASRFSEYLGSFRAWSAGVDTIYNASAQETGGERHVRFVTTADCKVDVREVELPTGGLNTFDATITGLKNLGYNRTDRKYMIFGESKVYCGIGTFAGDTQPGVNNRSNGGPGYGRADSGCWSPSVSAHELGHNLGAVNNNAPNSSKAGHCLDEYDVMCYNDSGGLKTSVKCADKAHDNRLDCNHDDYYNTNPSPGSYLTSNWNVANNQFLIAGGASNPPRPSPSVSPSASRSVPPSPSRSPSVSPTVSPPVSPTVSPTVSPSKSPPTGLKELRTSDLTATSVRLGWDAAADGTRYAIILNGHSIGQVRSTAVRIVGMRPDTRYQLGVAIATNGALTAWTQTVEVHTTAVPAPTTGTWMVFSNSLTGGVADVFGARSAAGTPIILYRRHGGANQQWTLEPAAGNTFLVRSKATNECVTTADSRDAVGATLVQQDCAAAIHWALTSTDFGVALTSPSGLVVGISNNSYLGSRLLVLQRLSGSRYQSWIAQRA